MEGLQIPMTFLHFLGIFFNINLFMGSRIYLAAPHPHFFLCLLTVGRFSYPRYLLSFKPLWSCSEKLPLASLSKRNHTLGIILILC